MKLLIVESPTKAKTISRFLPKEYKVVSSYGHVRDLPDYQLGVDIDNNFSPHYIVPRKNQKKVKELKALAKKSSSVILATDGDREGEAIAWHIAQILNLGKKSEIKNIERIVFHEITKQAIEEALKNPRGINNNLVNAQQARRVLDRLVGYKLSPFLWKKLIRGLSAGRVQSVALRLIVEREREIQAFKPETYWMIEAFLRAKKGGTVFSSQLYQIGENRIEKPGLKDKKEVDKIISELHKSEFILDAVEKKASGQKPKPPFTTSSLQQEAWRIYKFSAKKTMFLAQQLYEGIELKREKGPVGLITYMRTDSQSIAKEVIDDLRSYINKNYGPEFLEDSPRKFKKSSRLTQEAHEAIRPTDINRAPALIKEDLSADQFKLYDLIWRRTVASQMKDAVFDSTVFWISAGKGKEKKYFFRSSGQILKFPGFLQVYKFLKFQENELPDIKAKTSLIPDKIESSEHQTKPPPRYNDGSLVKTLEKFGIGRPSTYVPIIFTLKERGYIKENQAKNFIPTEIGFKVNDLLVEHFNNIVDIGFTSKMEEKLDDIAEGKRDWPLVVRDFYGPFSENLEKKYKEVEKHVELVGRQCPECKKDLIFRHSRFGKFIGCSGFPDCKYMEKIAKEKVKPLDKECLECGVGKLVQRRNRKGQVFYGCTKYPECKFTTSKIDE